MGMITLREAANAGMFPSVDAARKAAQRAQLVPAGRRGDSNLYWDEDLEGCQVRSSASVETADAPGETWKPIPGYPAYEASDLGRVRSIDRIQYGRTYVGTVLATRVSNRGYDLANVRDADGKAQTRTVHTLVLLAFTGPPPPGQVSRHLNDDPHDNRLANLAYGTPEENEQDKFRLGNRQPAAPKPDRHCARCGAVLPPGRGGKRCHECVVDIGKQAAELLRAGVMLDVVAERLEYPHLPGLHQLARVHGGYGPPVTDSEQRGGWLASRIKRRRATRDQR
jgi:hypothetical protein